MAKVKTTSYLKQLYSQPQFRVTANLFLSVITCLFFVSFAIRPTLSTIASLKKQIKDEQQVLTLLEQKVQALKTAEETYYQSQSHFDSLDRAIPTNPEVSRLATQITYLANLHNVLVESIGVDQFNLVDNKPVDKKTPAEKITVEFTLSFEGGWNDTKTFLEDLERIDRIVTISTVNQTVSENIISTTINGQVYYFPKKGYL
jgi:Tfp pilus assembly protein PilO